MRQLGIALFLSVFLTPHATNAKDKKNIPVAPLPAVVVNAKKVFLSNGGGSNLAYDAFYSEIKRWGKYGNRRLTRGSRFNRGVGLPCRKRWHPRMEYHEHVQQYN